MNSSGKRPEAYSTDKIRKRSIQFRVGRLLPMINTRPVGSDRIKAASRGRPGGRKLLVRRYVVPKMIGVSAARYAHRLEAASEGGALISPPRTRVAAWSVTSAPQGQRWMADARRDSWPSWC